MSMARASENDGGALGLLEEEEQGQEEEHQGGGQGQEVGQELWYTAGSAAVRATGGRRGDRVDG